MLFTSKQACKIISASQDCSACMEVCRNCLHDDVKRTISMISVQTNKLASMSWTMVPEWKVRGYDIHSSQGTFENSYNLKQCLLLWWAWASPTLAGWTLDFHIIYIPPIVYVSLACLCDQWCEKIWVCVPSLLTNLLSWLYISINVNMRSAACQEHSLCHIV